MWLILCAALCLQSEPAAGDGSGVTEDKSLTDITGQFELDLQAAEKEHAERRGMLFASAVGELAKIQKDLTRGMMFDDALRVRMIAERLQAATTPDDQLTLVMELLLEAPEPVTEVLKKWVHDDAEIRMELKSAVAVLAADCLDRLRKLLETTSAEGDLDACLEIRTRMEELQAAYQPDTGLPLEFPVTEDGMAKLKSQLLESSRQRIAVRLDELGVQLASLKFKNSADRRLMAGLVAKVTKERDLDEKVKLLRRMVEEPSVGQATVRSALTDVDNELMANSQELTRLEQRLKTMRNEELVTAVADWRIEDAVACYRRLQQAEPNGFPVKCAPEIPLDLPELDPECARIMDHFEAARQVEERLFMERLQPGIEELKRRLQAARAALPGEAKQFQEAVVRCRTWLDSPAADSLEEFRLIPATTDLPESVEAGAFAEAAEILLDERHEKRRAGLSGLQQQLQPAVARLAAAGDLPACVAVFVHLRWLGRRFDPQPARLSRVPWEAAATAVTVLDAAGKHVRLRHAGVNRSFWHARRLLRLEGEPALAVEPSAGNDGWRTADRFLPGPLIGRLSEVEPGMRVFWLRGNLWELVTVNERLGDDVSVQSEQDGKSRTDRIGWRGLYRLAW